MERGSCSSAKEAKLILLFFFHPCRLGPRFLLFIFCIFFTTLYFPAINHTLPNFTSMNIITLLYKTKKRRTFCIYVYETYKNSCAALLEGLVMLLYVCFAHVRKCVYFVIEAIECTSRPHLFTLIKGPIFFSQGLKIGYQKQTYYLRRKRTEKSEATLIK